ncbi:MAG: competence protein ComK [Bacillus sp. (in: Bacteria)]|nr:competence protein ComK [Bacillus sp. (in: firmicutes)]
MKFFSVFKLPYKINKRTMLIMPSRSWDYNSTVIETNKEIRLQDCPLEIIQRACNTGGSTMEERQMAITYLTGIDGRVPTPILPRHNIYAFPTHMPYHYECCWVFPEHISKIKPNKNNHKQSIIFFKNQLSLFVDVPAVILIQQLNRMPRCIHRYSNWIKAGHTDSDVFIS